MNAPLAFRAHRSSRSRLRLFRGGSFTLSSGFTSGTGTGGINGALLGIPLSRIQDNDIKPEESVNPTFGECGG